MVLYLKRYFGISILENIHKYLIKNRQSDCIEDRIALSIVLSQINYVEENHYQFAEEHLKSECLQLRNLILVWLLECSTASEVEE